VPIDVGRIFFVGGGSEAIETALKVARQYHRLRGEPTRYKFITRRSAYHGDDMGALSINGSPALRSQFEPLLARLPARADAVPLPMPVLLGGVSLQPARCATRSTTSSRTRGPETVAAVILEPVQNSAGSITPPEGYFERVARSATSTAPARGRRGHLRLRPRRRLVRDDPLRDRAGHDDRGQGDHLGYAPLGALIANERTIEPFFARRRPRSRTGSRSAAIPLSCAIALANSDVFEQEDLVGRSQTLGPELRERCEALLEEHPMVGDVRGDGYFYSLELVKDKETKETFTPAERDDLIKTFLLPRTRELGVYMRFDDRGETCAQFAAAARGRAGRVRRDGGRPAPGARRGVGPSQHEGGGIETWLPL
jgi:adenosylmethionine-8-amino-7-oxononanoate aminotransferase